MNYHTANFAVFGAEIAHDGADAGIVDRRRRRVRFEDGRRKRRRRNAGWMNLQAGAIDFLLQ